MPTVKLSMPTLLPKIWAAYMAKELQAQVQPTFACSYAGPCAVGVGVPEIQRATLDRAMAPEITHLIHSGRVNIASGESPSEYSKLQGKHDAWSGAIFRQHENSKEFETAFIEYVVTLSKKYDVEIPDEYLSVQS